MFNLSDILMAALKHFFSSFFEDLIGNFATALASIMGASMAVLEIPLVINGIKYAQLLSIVILAVKAGNEAFQTYILYQNGDPDADPNGLLIRTGQAVAIISCLPWILTELFILGSKIALDVAGLGTGTTGIADWAFVTTVIVGSNGLVIPILFVILAVMLLIVAIQATIRGGELALMGVLGPFMALNLTANNRSIWSAWFKQAIIINCTQGLQIFMLMGALALLTSGSISDAGLLLVFGWLWVTIKSPKYVQQIAYSTGFTGAVGGTAKQAGTFYAMRTMMAGA